MSLLRQVNIKDSNGVSIVADKSGGIRASTELQSAVHDGNMFSFTSHGTITAGSSIIMLGRTGAKQVHFDGFNIEVSQGTFLVEMFEAPTVTTAGSLQTAVNRNRVSTTTATMSLYAGATVSANGTLIADDQLLTSGGAGGGGGSSALGGTAIVDDGWILKTSTDYIIKLTNQAGTTTSYNAKFAWHEPSYILT